MENSFRPTNQNQDDTEKDDLIKNLNEQILKYQD